MRPSLTAPSARLVFVDIATLLLVAWVLRGIFLFFLPVDAVSADLAGWNRVAQELSQGNNPYQTTTVLNWPPVWIQIIFWLSKIATLTGFGLTRIIQCFLISVESISLLVSYLCLSRFFPAAPVKKILLFGISLNPISIYQVCQHGNFDMLVGLWVVSLVYFLFAYGESAESIDWLLATMFLGLGIVTKTTPIMLVPVCLLGARQLTTKHKVLAAFLIFFPVCFGVGILYTLAPADIALKVLGYRSGAGWFGITGILRQVPHWDQFLVPIYVKISSLGLLAFLAFMSLRCFVRSNFTRLQLLWTALLMFLVVITFGPGYGPQYIEWFWPLLLLVYAAEGETVRRILRVMFFVAIVTYTVEYALYLSHGSFLLRNNPSHFMQSWGERWSTERGQTLTRLPLFVCYIKLFRLAWKKQTVA